MVIDYKPLTYAIKFGRSNAPPREISHLSYVAEYMTDVRYIKGALNTAAEKLTRMYFDQISMTEVEFSYPMLADAQPKDTELNTIASSWTSLVMETLFFSQHGIPFYSTFPQELPAHSYRDLVSEPGHSCSGMLSFGPSTPSVNRAFGRRKHL